MVLCCIHTGGMVIALEALEIQHSEEQMKKILRMALATVSLLVATLPSYALTISLTPTSQTVDVGQTLQFDLVVTGLGSGAAPSLGTYDLDISFDPGILNFSGAVFGDAMQGNQLDLFGFLSINAATTGVGTVNLFELSFDDPTDLNLLQSENFTLATLSFSALSSGTSSLGINVNALGDAFGDPLTAQLVGAQATVNQASPVPEPSGLALAMAGLLTLATVRTVRARLA